MLFLGEALALATCAAPSNAGGDASSQHDAYVERSVEIISAGLSNNEAKLAALISPDATFSLGSGDVGMPLGSGHKGAEVLADELRPAQYFYNGWDYMPLDQDACGKITVEIQWLPADESRIANIRFSYFRGMLVSAEGWWRSWHTGRIGDSQSATDRSH